MTNTSHSRQGAKHAKYRNLVEEIGRSRGMSGGDRPSVGWIAHPLISPHRLISLAYSQLLVLARVLAVFAALLVPVSGFAQAGPAPFVFATVRYESGNWDSAPLVPSNIIHSLAQYTSIPVAPEGVIVDLDGPELFRYPFVYLTGHLPVRFTHAESRNLRLFVERGGFVFIDDHNHDIDGAFHKTATAELARIFGPEALQQVPNDHELYRAFFHFEDGPPTTSHELSGWGDNLIHEHLYGIEVNGRLGVLYSNKDYSSEWNYHYPNKRFLAVDNTRFGVNVVIYALTR